ncbi:MAG: hypothetical protein EP329_09875 [Deltaproteobacteria bacterium]|nr:MAG: hypothetical protein EP329_09875 [Deltaproteobacteria bacterium]
MRVSVDFSRKTDEVASALEALKERGDVSGFEGAARRVQEALGIPDGVVNGWISDASQRAEDLRRDLGKNLRQIAEREQCFFEYRPPRITFGCVEMHEERESRWNLTVLDTISVAKIEATRAEELAEAALEIIRGIENALLLVQDAAKGLTAGLDWLNAVYSEPTEHPVNLVRLFCIYGKDARRELGTGTGFPKIKLTREAFGYVLARIQRLAIDGRDEGYPELTFRGATQHVTKDPARYVSIPKNDNPRKPSQHSPIAAINLSAKRKETDR